MIGYMQIEQDRAIVTKMYLSSSVNFRLECREESIGLGCTHLAIGFVTVMRRMKQMQAMTSTSGVRDQRVSRLEEFYDFVLTTYSCDPRHQPVSLNQPAYKDQA